MNLADRKKVAVLIRYAKEFFTHDDWIELGNQTGEYSLIAEHPRLLRSLSFGDDDYGDCVSTVLSELFNRKAELIDDVLERFEIDRWYEENHPQRYQRVFLPTGSADFWTIGYLKLFLSHLSSSKTRISALKSNLATWGICAFVAHEDIQPTREWQVEIKAGLETMDVLAAVVEPGFRESDWCAQEVGFALGRKVEVIPLRRGMDPFGLFGALQGIQIKGKKPSDVSIEIAHLLLKKNRHKEQVIEGMGLSFPKLPSAEKIRRILLVESWGILTDKQLRTILERSDLSSTESDQLRPLLIRTKARSVITTQFDFSDDVAF